MALGVLQRALHPVSLALDVRQLFRRHLRRSIAQRVLDLTRRVDLAPDEQMPLTRRLFAPRVDPHPGVQHFIADRSARAFPGGGFLPGIGRLLGHPFTHTLPPAPFTCGRHEPDQMIAMHIHHELQPGRVQREQECVLPVPSVCRDPLETNGLFDRLDNDLER